MGSIRQVFWPTKGDNPASWVKNTTTYDWESPAGLLPDLDPSEILTHYWRWDEDTTVGKTRICYTNSTSRI